jgi:signal transduction histidine kinase
LRQRGTRIDESRAGNGLGLAIVGDIVAQYGGALRLDRSELLGRPARRRTLTPTDRRPALAQ